MGEVTSNWPREGYRPEWLALEDASGGRYIMTGDLNVDVPLYNTVFSAMSKQWPQYEDELEVWDETTNPLPKINDRSLPVRIYKPKSSASTPLPLMIMYPGGGYVTGNLETEDAQARYFATKTPCLLICVNYPKAIEEGIDLNAVIASGVGAVPWCKKRAAEILERSVNDIPTLLAGGSAGACLSLQVAHHYVTQLKDTSSIDGLILLYPVTLHYDYADLPDSEAPPKYKSRYKAWAQNGYNSVPVFGKKVAEIVWAHWKPDFSSPSHFPFLSSDEVLVQLPPMYLVCAEKDCVRDDTLLLHWRITEELGVKSKLDYYDGVPHWFHMFPQLEVAREMMAKTVEGARWCLAEAAKKKKET